MTTTAAPARSRLTAPPLPGERRERMIRSPDALARRVVDVLVVGGGIHGAWVARDAARRGLSVALIEQDDFGSGTSSNSQKIIHGGLRYLQHGHLRRMRQSIRERRALLRLAPHLVSPMPVLVPIYAGRWPGRLSLGAAMLVNDLMSLDRNRGVASSHEIGRGRLLSRAACLDAAPGLPQERLRGGALFTDAQVRNPERLLLAVLWAAVRDGAVVANRMRLREFLREGERIAGAVADDELTGSRLTIRASLTVNCTGPWLAETLGLAAVPDAQQRFRVFEAIVLITRRLTDGIAVAVSGRESHVDGDEVFRRGYRNYFITPWRDVSLVGTFYRAVRDGAGPPDLDELLAAFNAAWPAGRLSRADVRHVCAGRLPLDPSAASPRELRYAKRAAIVDHAAEHGVAGLISVCGVKWTTARLVAERAVDLALCRLGRPRARCRTAHEALDAPSPDRAEPAAGVKDEVSRHLALTYGAAAERVRQYGAETAHGLHPIDDHTPVTPAEVMHAVDAEMALSLADVVFRRTDLATAGHPGRAALETCANIMAPMLGWDAARVRREIERVEETFDGLGGAR